MRVEKGAAGERREVAGMDMTPYCGDDYDRMGCRAVIEVLASGYQLTIFAPNGAWMESYRSVKSPRAVSRMLREWAEGKVPRLSAHEDQVSESKS